MYYHIDTGVYIQEGTPFTLNEVQYPANWLQLASPEQKQDMGIVETVTYNSPEDDRFYWVNSTWNEGVLTYTNTPKDLTVLKTQWKNTIRQQAYSLLQSTDYMEIRNMRDATYKPEWMVWRESVRDTASMALVAIGTASTVEEVQTAIKVVWPNNPDYVELVSTTPVFEGAEEIPQ
jgi:hypothetical protein